jgi:ubiquinone/menaquinone biosynthesis C-methylase UbiE
MSTGLQYDEESSRRVEAMYMTPDVVAQRHAVLRAMALRTGERVVDVGSGPGYLAADMGAAVGPTGRICGIDISDSMIAMARARCVEQPWVELRVGDATQLPFADGEFDVAVSTQVCEYVSDASRALEELHRVLRPGGRALILDTDWDSMVWHTTDRGRMDRVLAAWNDHCVDPYLPRTLAPTLTRLGFLVQHRDVIPLFNPVYDANTYSYGLIGLIGAFVVGRRGVTQEEVTAWAGDLRQLGEDGSYFFSVNRYLFVALKPETSSTT